MTVFFRVTVHGQLAFRELESPRYLLRDTGTGEQLSAAGICTCTDVSRDEEFGESEEPGQHHRWAVCPRTDMQDLECGCGRRIGAEWRWGRK